MRLLFGLMFFVFAAFAHAQIVGKDIPSRPGVTVRIAYAKAENPVASAVLFQGGPGKIGVFPNGSIKADWLFLSGGAKRFTDNNITVAIIDAPTDRQDLNGKFRSSQEHAEDAAAVIAFLRSESKLPVWAIGTSNGSLSAANAAERLESRGPDGIVLTASATNAAEYPDLVHIVTDAKLLEISLPTLWVHHKGDECKHTPYDAIPPLVASMKKSSRVELITVEGGNNSKLQTFYRPCNSGYHQFQGIESDVIKSIADWIKKVEAGR
ncbi:MAG: alpha/beta hydrolase [Rhodocyclaceae bacterium]|nr:alpha/beta hydrolase [Rhodocyclaceae bacterium]MBX3670425.1 alpha/beta hydrolase [Rhodocyclaceae bacterium]